MLVHPSSPAQETSPGAEEIMKYIAEADWLEKVGVATVIDDLTVGPYGFRCQAIHIGLGGAGQKEAPTNCGRQGPQEGILEGWHSQENPEVPIRNSCPS